MQLEPVKRIGISEDVIRRILKLIQEGQLAPGDRLPNERELAAALQVSRPMLREGLRALAFMKVIEIRQGDGTYVTSLTPELLTENLDWVFSLDESSSDHLLQARKVVEPGIAALAAPFITDQELLQLEECLRHAQDYAHDIPLYVDSDICFHRTIFDTARNPILKRFMASVTHLDRVVRINILECLPEAERTFEIRQVREDHGRIIEALRAHDPQAAQAAMLDHLNNVEKIHILAKQKRSV